MSKSRFIYGTIMVTLAFGTAIVIQLGSGNYHLALLSLAGLIVFVLALSVDYFRGK